MALMQIRQPRQQTVPTAAQPSGLDKDLQRLLTGLQIANAGFGIAVNYQNLDTQKLDQQLKERQLANLPTPEQSQRLTEAKISGAEGVAVQQRAAGDVAAQSIENVLRRKQLETQKLNAEIDALRSKKPEAKTIQGLRNEWISNPITKKTSDASVAANKALSYRKLKNPTAIDQHSLIFNYMKTIDPTSTVREGEFTTVEQAQGKFDQYTIGLFNKTLRGELLTPQQSQNIVNTVDRLYSQQLDQQNRLNQEYSRLAESQGIPADQVVLDLGFEQPQAAQAEPAFSETDIQEVMRRTGEDRGRAILRLQQAAQQMGQ